MADYLNPQDLANAKVDAKTLGEAVNDKKIIKPRYGDSYKSIPMISADGESAITELKEVIDIAAAAGAGENGWTDLLITTEDGGTQREKNREYDGLFDLSAFDNMHRRKVLHDLDWNFPEHDQWVVDAGGDPEKTVIGYGSFQIDTVEREIWMYGTTDNSKVSTSYVYFVIYDLDTGAFKKAYRASLDGYASSCEGFVLTRKFAGGRRLLYTVGVNRGIIYEFSVDNLPASGSDIVYSKTHNIMMSTGEQMALDEATGLFYIESNTPSVATHSDRKILVIYSSNFKETYGHIDVGIHNSGYVADSRVGGAGRYFHKRQGFAVYGGCIALSFGGGANSNINSKPFPDYHTHQQGCRIINMGAETIKESFFDPALYIKKRNSVIGVDYYECEHEGVAFTPDGKLYTHEVAFHLLHREGKKGGWLITEVFSNDPSATDYSDCATNRSHPNMFNPLFLNRMDGNSWINPYTGKKITKLDELFYFMEYTQKSEVSFVANGVFLLDTDGEPLSSKFNDSHVKVYMSSGGSFVLDIIDVFRIKYKKTGGVWVKAEITKDEVWAGKKYMIFGDSITQTGNPDVGNFGFGYRSNWWESASKQLKASSFMNFARSGAAFRQLDSTVLWHRMQHQVDYAVNESNYIPDVVVVACGTNDGLVNLGSYEDAMSKNIESLDLLKTADAMRYSFYHLNKAFPSATLFVCTPIQRVSVDTLTIEPLTNLLKDMAKRYGFQVIDVGAESGIVRDFEVLGAAGRDLGDGLHTLPSGKLKMTNVIAPAIKARLQ